MAATYISMVKTSNNNYHAVITPNTYEGDTKQAELVQEVMAYVSDENNVLLGHKFNVISPVVMTVDVNFQSTAGSSAGLYIALANYDTATVNKAKEVLNSYLAGGSLSFRVAEFKGLNLGEQFTAFNLQENLSTYLGDLFVSLTEVGDCHTFSSENKYRWNYEWLYWYCNLINAIQ